jgi:hypothetical protein
MRWRRPSLDDLDGRAAALRGEVRVSEPLHVEGIGDCLWHLRTVEVGSGKRKRTESFHTDKAEFSIVIESRAFVVPDKPSEVAGQQIKVEWEGNRCISDYWLPVVGHLTVLGRVQKPGKQWEIVKDRAVGLIYSIHPPERTAIREAIKAGIGLIIVALGSCVLYQVYRHAA